MCLRRWTQGGHGRVRGGGAKHCGPSHSEAEQERQQLASSSTETNQLQNELYAAALADFRQKNGKYPTPAQVGRLWDTAMLRAHDKLHSHSNDRGPDHEGAVACEQRRSRRRKRIRVEGVGFLDFH